MSEEYELSFSPEQELVDLAENHLGKSDSLLRALLDMAEVGRGETETGELDTAAGLEINSRFHAILDLLAMYRESNSTLVTALYDKMKALKAA
jgi:hypothetical protein